MHIKQQNNFSLIPNHTLDAIPFLNLKNLESRIFFLILRETYGFHKRKAYISASWFARCTGINSHGSVNRAINSLIDKEIIIRTSSTDFKTASAFQINEDFFKKVIHRNFNEYPKRTFNLPANQQGGVPANQQGGVPANQQGGVPANQQDIKESIKENNKESIKEIIPDLSTDFSLKEYKPNQIQKIREVISSSIDAHPDSEAVTVYLREQVLKTSKQRGIKDKFAYTLQSCRNLQRELKRG